MCAFRVCVFMHVLCVCCVCVFMHVSYVCVVCVCCMCVYVVSNHSNLGEGWSAWVTLLKCLVLDPQDVLVWLVVQDPPTRRPKEEMERHGQERSEGSGDR